MNIDNLKLIFRNLPNLIYDDLGYEPFDILWYPFSGLDMGPLCIFDPKNRRSVVYNHKTQVFFYTDHSYSVLNNGAFFYENNEILDNTYIKSNYQDCAPSKLVTNSYLVKLNNISKSNVRLNIFKTEEGLNLYCFFIPIENFEF